MSFYVIRLVIAIVSKAIIERSVKRTIEEETER